MKNILLLLVFFLLTPLLSFSQRWNLKIDRDGIQVYNLKNDTSKINELRVVTELNGTPKVITKIIMDVANHSSWVYGTKSGQLISKPSDSELIFYKEIRSPAPLSNRDLIAYLKVENLTDSKATIKVIAKPTILPEKKGLVRVPFFQETWLIKSTTADKSKVEYFLRIDPGGTIPPMLVNLFSTKGPYESFVNLKELVKKMRTAK